MFFVSGERSPTTTNNTHSLVVYLPQQMVDGGDPNVVRVGSMEEKVAKWSKAPSWWLYEKRYDGTVAETEMGWWQWVASKVRKWDEGDDGGRFVG